MLVMDTSDIFSEPSFGRRDTHQQCDPPPAPPFQGGEQSAPVATPPLEKGRDRWGSDPFKDQDLTELTAALREQILEAQERLSRGDVKGAEALGRATLQLIRAVEAQVKLESSQKAGQREGVFFAREEIEAARAELSRRVERIAAHIRARAVDEGAS